MKLITKSEDTNCTYVWFFGKRLILKDGKFIGWYRP